MRTAWKYSPQTETARLVHVASHVASGFFKANNFWVLPYGKCPNLENCVSLPDLPYLSIPRFWDRCSRINTKVIPLRVPPDLLRATEILLAGAGMPKPNWSKTEERWFKIEKKIIAEIYKLIPAKKNWIKKIVIWPTAFGTGASFNLVRRPPYDIYIWLRADRGVAAIVESILTSLTRLDVYSQLGGMWSESEIIVDWLLKYSPLYPLLRQSDPNVDRTYTIKATRATQQAKLLQESAAFLARLGAPTTDTSTLKNLVTNGVLSPREKEILQLLLSHSPQVVTFDEIGDILFSKNPDNFSLYAITKQVQRLRDKLEKNGISGSFIQTKRGKGYLLVN